MKKVIIYTDGACSGNPGIGGWAAILKYKGHEKQISGYEENTTNNRMELKAAIEALKLLKEPCEVELYSDSAYLVNGFNNGWVETWEKNNWMNNEREQVKNIEMWKELEKLNNIHKISFIKIKGHSNNEYNNKCDELAKEQIKRALSINPS